MTKVLVFDVETIPAIVWMFGNKIEWLRPNQIVQESRMICFGAKWLGEKSIIVSSEWDEGGREGMARKMFALADEADILVAYNGDRFDIKKINTLFEQHGLGRPSPFRSIDPYKAAKKHLDLPSYSLKSLLAFYGLSPKIQTSEQLWKDIVLDGTPWGDPEAAAKARKAMLKYQKQDVVVLEQLWHKIKPWFPPIPAFAIGSPDKCDACGGDVQYRGYALTLTGKYQRWQCTSCARWGKVRWAESTAKVAGL